MRTAPPCVVSILKKSVLVDSVIRCIIAIVARSALYVSCESRMLLEVSAEAGYAILSHIYFLCWPRS